MASNNPFNFRIGFGVDRHQLVTDRPLILGGVEIDSDLGALGHSDADVLLHAICDALLGAANLRDIGYHFPDTDLKYKGADSVVLLGESFKLIQSKGYSVGNLDCTIFLEEPKLSSYVPEMTKNISETIKLDMDAVSIKATRGEKVGPVGRREAIQAYCSALIYKN
jgi:2-C-methyl-D-erythritol 2,4-cyclodiphosphate synthase